MLLTTLCLTGCKNEKPYSFYRIGIELSGYGPGETWSEADLALGSYLANHGYIRNETTQTLIFEGGDQAANDAQAVQVYENLLADLQRDNNDYLLHEAQATKEGPRSNEFNYVITRGQHTITGRLEANMITISRPLED